MLRNHAVRNLLSAGTVPPDYIRIRKITDDLCLRAIFTNPGQNHMSASGVGAKIVGSIKGLLVEWVREEEVVTEAELGMVMNGEREGKLDVAAM